MTLQDRLHARLSHSPLPFRDWMAACLYDATEGYYTRMRPSPRTGPAPEADFATSPTLHPFFAQCVAREALAVWRALGKPAGFRIAEFGGGQGDLARDALAWLERKGWQPAWLHIEVGQDHRLAQRGPGTTHVDELPEGFVGLVVAHEFLDALPVHLMQRTQTGWDELAVAEEDGQVGLVARPASADALEAVPPVPVPPGHRVVANAAARHWIMGVASRMQTGAVVVVDYGDEGMRLWGRDPEWGTIRTFRQHQDAGSPLEGPGRKDITASIDFAQCRHWAQEAGLEQRSLETQETFLLRHGVLEELNAIDRGTVDGASAYLRLRQMLIPHAGGMGRAFKVAIYEKLKMRSGSAPVRGVGLEV